MVRKRALGWGLRLGAVVVVLPLLAWLGFSVLSQTRLSADPANREVAAETTLGNLSCRKEVRAAFPYVTLKCRDVWER